MTQHQQYNRPHFNTGGTSDNATPKPSYQERYRRTPDSVLGKVFDAGPHLVGLASFILTLVALMLLMAVDPITGKYTAAYMYAGNEALGWMTSGATTGLVIAFLGAALYAYRERWGAKVIIPLFGLALIPIGIDIMFDMYAVDIIKYGHPVDLGSMGLPKLDIFLHWSFRIMAASMSAVGEPLAVVSVIIFPVLKEIFKGIL